MATLALNKTSLHKENLKLKTFERFLPTLDLKRKQLLMERAKAAAELKAIRDELSELEDLVGARLPMVSNELVDLSKYSFRLWNSAINADLYEDFYGSDGTYGAYVSENMVSAALLDYETLQTVSMKLRVGETADNLLLFFDLNPQSTARNEGVTMAGTNLVIYDTETGDQVEINLDGYAD